MTYVFVHGLGQTDSSWNETIEDLMLGADSLVPNLFELCTEEMNYSHLYTAFCDYVNATNEPLNLCGVSLGGILALNYTIDHPHKVQSLALVGARYAMPKKLMTFQNVLFKLMSEKPFEKIGVSKKDMIALTKSMMDLDFSKQLSRIECPTLIVCGENDKANMKASERLKDLLSKSTLCVIPKTGHAVNTENPKLLAETLRDFYKGIGKL